MIAVTPAHERRLMRLGYNTHVTMAIQMLATDTA